MFALRRAVCLISETGRRLTLKEMHVKRKDVIYEVCGWMAGSAS